MESLKGKGELKTLFGMFKLNRDYRPDSTAFMIAAGDRSVPITWRQFTEDISAVAWVIQRYSARGVIALLGENSYEWIVGHAACVFSGVTVLPLEVSLSPSEIAEHLRFTGAEALIHSALYSEKAKESCKMVPGVQIGEFGSRRTDMFVNMGRDALANGEKSVFDRPPPDDTKTSMIVFTSGTTSKPKGVELTLRGMALFAEYAQTRLKVKPGDRSLMVLPMHHIFGICATYFMLSQGVALGVCPDFRRLYDTVERFRVNFICLVPALAEVLAEKIALRARSAEEAFGSPIDWILVGGAPLPRRVYENLAALGVQTLTAYGLTETTALYSIATYGDDPHVGSVGRACDLPGVETKVSKDGILLIRGMNVFKGYYQDPDATSKVLSKDGWFTTGDYGRIDADGFVWVTGRASRTIVLSSGKKVAPEELEEKILALPGIRETVVSGNGESREIMAEVYASIPEVSVRREITALNNNLPVYKRIRTVVVRKEPFPRTDSGKIRVTRNPAFEANVHRSSTMQDAVQGSVVPSKRKIFGSSVLVMVLFVVAAMAFAVVGLVPHLLTGKGVHLSNSVMTIFEIVDIAGELLLGLLALLLVLKIWDRRN